MCGLSSRGPRARLGRPEVEENTRGEKGQVGEGTMMDIKGIGQEEMDSRTLAYRAGADIARTRMGREAPASAEALEAGEAADGVVVAGCYDHVEQVLGALEVRL